MPSAVIVVGAVEGVRRDLERHIGERARVLIIRLARQGGFRLEPHPLSAVQMVESAADSADGPTNVMVIVLPYAACPPELAGTITALEELGTTVSRPRPGEGRWPSRPPTIDGRFQFALRDALLAAIDAWLPGEPTPESVEEAVARARTDFAGTLHIPSNVTIETSLDGPFWYGVLHALHDLCELERRGDAANKRDLLRDLLNNHVRAPKRTYKVADTGVFITDAATGERHHLRERVHIVEGKPAETESVYWITVGEVRASYRYLIGQIGRHA